MPIRWYQCAVVMAPLVACTSRSLQVDAGGAGSGGMGARSGGSGAFGLSGGSSGAGALAGLPGAGGSGNTAGAALGGDAGGGTGGLAASGGAFSGGAGAISGASGSATGGNGGGMQLGGAGNGSAAGGGGAGGEMKEPVSLQIFDEVVFYDAYAQVVNEPVPAGVQRLRNDLFTHRLSETELDAIQSTLKVRVIIGALCDNYDRIGSVALALVPKGKSTYRAEDVERVEIGRYITPFMDRNRKPDEVPYDYRADHLVSVLHDVALRSKFDLWLELELFGVPYAANDEIAGCANRSDVFRGSVVLESDSKSPAPSFDQLIPVAYKQPFNNYQSGASDKIGTTRKTVEFTLDVPSVETQLVLITSNHGANSGGEEYSRRDHFVSLDGKVIHMYKPGRTSCEPFRKYNTQANGIYGSSARSDSSWQSFSNWCPGDVIDTRIISVGALAAGTHEFSIDVPDAMFSGKDGNFPFSLYVQSRNQ